MSAEEVERYYEAAARRPRQPGADQLHVRGAEATVVLAELAALREGERVLDGGAGLGLAIARGVVESHQGEIAVRNTEAGCCFEVALPQARQSVRP